MKNHACGEWCDCEPLEMTITASEKVPPIEKRQINHCYKDCKRALEDGRLKVETPTLCVDMSRSSVTFIGVGRETEQLFVPGSLEPQTHGNPYVELEFDMLVEETNFFEDLNDHVVLEGPLVLHGDIHLWRMDTQVCDLEMMQDVGTDQLDLSFNGKWYEAEPIGWR
jgi:hypothetical protein